MFRCLSVDEWVRAVVQEKPELKRGSFKSKERFELKRHSESKID